ncbi:branched-chain amino acid ABC transporter permease [Alcaligenaceae bacterium]|nr:branched-chain amino acid ABC transporter permease [Alcaligenaceae bacterium]
MLTLTMQALVNGLIVGFVYGLIGVGLNIIFGVLRVVNFSHGEFVILGSYFAYVAMHFLNINPLLAVPLSLIVFTVLGYGLYYLLIARLATSDDPETASLLMTYGLSIAMGASMLLIFDAESRSLDFSIEPAFVMMGPLVIPTLRIVSLLIVLLLVVALFWLQYRTFTGKALRAITMNRDAVQIVGVDVHKLSAIAFGLGLGLAAVAGVLTALIFPAFSPFSGADYTLIGFILIVLGGLGHPVGALVASILFGMTEQVSAVYFNSSIALIIGFMMIVVVIYVRPSGLFGRAAQR